MVGGGASVSSPLTTSSGASTTSATNATQSTTSATSATQYIPQFSTPKEGYQYFHQALQNLSTWAIQQRRTANTDINAQIRAIENNAMRDTSGQMFVNPATGLRDMSISQYLQSLYSAAGSNSNLISSYVNQQRPYLLAQQEYYRRLM